MEGIVRKREDCGMAAQSIAASIDTDGGGQNRTRGIMEITCLWADEFTEASDGVSLGALISANNFYLRPLVPAQVYRSHTLGD